MRSLFLGAVRPTLTVLVAASLCWVCLSAGHGQPPPPVDLTGTVMLPDGAPAGKATIELALSYDWSKLAATTQADAAGRFSLILPPGAYFLRARLDTCIYETTEPLQIGMGGIAPVLQITLAKGCALSGILTNSMNDKPVGGAKILVRNWPGTTTAEDGTFDLGIVPKGIYTIAILKTGFAHAITNRSADRDAVTLKLRTLPEGVMKGRVTNAKGEPVAGARVGPSGWYFDFQHATTNANGEYLLSGLDPAQIFEVLMVSADGYEYFRKTGITFPDGQRTVTVDVRLTPSRKDVRTITGQVKADGKPVAGAKVGFGFGIYFENHRSTFTDAGGNFTLHDVSAEKNLVCVQAEGFAPAFQIVEAKGTPPLEFTLLPGHQVEGRFVDEDGNPLAGFHISAGVRLPELDQMGMMQWTYELDAEAVTNMDGHFRQADLPPGKVIIDAYGPGNTRVDGLALAVDRDDQRVEISKHQQVSGTVVSAVDGKPISEFTITDEFHEQGTAYHSPDGRFTISNTFMKKGHKTVLVVDAPGFCRSYQNTDVKSPKEADPSQFIIRLQPAVTFTGTITDHATGKGLEGVHVTVLDTTMSDGISSFDWSEIPEAWHPIPTYTDAGGHFRLDAVPIRYGDVLLRKAGYGYMVLPGVSLHRPLQINMEPEAVITGQALDENGKPLAEASIEAQTPDGIQHYSAKSEADGSFRITELAAGDYVVHQEGEKTGKMVYVSVRASEHFLLNWNPPGAATLEGTVMHHGMPAAGAELLLYPENGFMYDAFGKSGTNGAFTLTVPKAGQHMLMVSLGEWEAPNHVRVNLPVTINPGANRLRIELPGAEVAGQLLDRKTGKPLAGVLIQAYVKMAEFDYFGRNRLPFSTSPTLHWFSQGNPVRTDGNGRFILRNLREGECLIALQGGEGEGIPTQAFTLGKDEKKDMKVEVPLTGSAHLAVVDAATGKPIPDMAAICLDAQGFWFSPEHTQDMTGYSLRRTPEGQIIFNDLPAGRYVAYSAGAGESGFLYPVSTTAFEVKAGETAVVTLPVKRGGRLVYQLKENDDDRMPGKPWVGVTITSPAGRPVLEDHSGVHPGDQIRLFGIEAPRRGYLPLRPGTYRIEAVLGYDVGNHSAPNYLWRSTQTITIEDGKDLLIEIPWKAGG